MLQWCRNCVTIVMVRPRSIMHNGMQHAADSLAFAQKKLSSHKLVGQI